MYHTGFHHMNAIKVYFTASIIGKKLYEKNYLRIIDILKKQNSEVIADHIIHETDKRILAESKEERLAFQDQMEKWIATSDCVIAESSYPSTSVGFEISLALHLGKPVLILYCDTNPPSLLTHHKSEKLICEHYRDETVNEIIEDFLRFVQGNTDIRYTFFMPSYIAQYLEKICHEKRIAKSVYIRNLIEKDMQQQAQP